MKFLSLTMWLGLYTHDTHTDTDNDGQSMIVWALWLINQMSQKAIQVRAMLLLTFPDVTLEWFVRFLTAADRQGFIEWITCTKLCTCGVAPVCITTIYNVQSSRSSFKAHSYRAIFSKHEACDFLFPTMDTTNGIFNEWLFNERFSSDSNIKIAWNTVTWPAN